MAAKKTKPVVKQHHHISPKEKEPEYVVQIQDPRMVRKGLLESLRDLIIFMQGYEQFRKLQEMKVAQFTALRNDVKELNHLLDVKLRHHFPKGKVHHVPVAAAPKPAQQIAQREEMEEQKQVVVPVRAPVRKEVSAPTPKKSDLDELEQQLQDIENQLRDVK
ncbi:MAG: hypothetical protein Q7K45_04455 [Nanoarchaeota archaeon]|nr:hypothetical protein [Nanoarchaeota archaeon]